MVSSVFFMTMDDALSMVHGSEIDLLAVVASIGPMKRDPCGRREICVKDTRLVYISILLAIKFMHVSKIMVLF
jgi:hypothetical protein